MAINENKLEGEYFPFKLVFISLEISNANEAHPARHRIRHLSFSTNQKGSKSNVEGKSL